jgi:hypothetical protein
MWQFSNENLLISNAKLYTLQKYRDPNDSDIVFKTLYSSNDGINFSILNNINLPNVLNDNNQLVYASKSEYKVLKIDNNTIYVGTKYVTLYGLFDSYRVYKSTDNGLNWSFFIRTAYEVVDILCNNSITYVVDATWIYKSINNGFTWTWSRPNNVFGGINCAVLKGNDVYIGTGSWGGAPSGQGIAKSADGGVSWSFVNNGLIPFLTKQLFVLGSNLLAVTSNYNDSIGYVFLSSNEGLNWHQISSSELNAKCPIRVNADNNFLYCGTKYNGLWRVAINSLATDSFDSESIKSTIYVYPNPTTSKITIDCSNLINFIDYQIKIVNPLGQEIYHSMLNQQVIEIPLSSIATRGLYFVSIINNEGKVINTKKIILN